MLKSIHCDQFAPEHQTILFNSGLNTVLGNAAGSNAIGKSIFLWIIDYVFGGTSYYTRTEDIRDEIGSHTIYFTFEFENHPYHFYRNTNERDTVYQSDEKRRYIGKLTLKEYQKFLLQEYKMGTPSLDFSELTRRFFRIYGRENTSERYPLLMTRKERDEVAVDFLLRLFGYQEILSAIDAIEEELGIKVTQLKKRTVKRVDVEQIENNQATIESMQTRLRKLMNDNEDAQILALGFDTHVFEEIAEFQKELTGLVSKRNQLKSQLNAIINNISDTKNIVETEFESLIYFFPNANLKAFQDIESFHNSIRRILKSEIDAEIERLQPLIKEYDREIERLKRNIRESGLAREMSSRVLSQCVNLSKSIDRLEQETAELLRQREFQDARVKAEATLQEMVDRQTEKLYEIQDRVNWRMESINNAITEQQEIAPTLQISPQKEITFGTLGNTSEGTAFKSLVLYDLSILDLCPLPMLIHDSNILKRLEDIHLEHILEHYIESGRQIFIAFDKADSTTRKAHEILESTSILRLSNNNKLFGRSWSNETDRT